MSHGSSKPSGPVCILRAERSRLLSIWWCLLHAVIGASVLMLPVGVLAVVLLVPVLAHARWRWPTGQGGVLLLSGNDQWGLPVRGRFGLRPGPGTLHAPLWVRLVLTDAAGGPVVLLLLRDQFSAEDWRKIQVAVRECDTMD